MTSLNSGQASQTNYETKKTNRVRKETTTITSFLGFPVVESAVFKHVHVEEESYESPPKMFALITIAIFVLILACSWSAFGVVQNCPDTGHLSESSYRECIESLSKVEKAHKNTEQQLEKLNNDITRLVDEKANLSRKLNDTENKLNDTENKLNEAREELKKAKQEKENLLQENSLVKSEKETIKTDLSSTQYTLGNCKNKNMDHEVQNLELLQEIESLKKELKAC